MRKSILLIVLLNLFYIGNAQCWQSVSAGINTTLGIKTDGTLWACGVNWNGQLGDGTTTNKNYFVQELFEYYG
jgi:alpha-tubulin suppressor-like RCC1 family protein